MENYAPSDELIQCQPLHTNHEEQLYGMMINFNSFVVVIECVTSDPNPAFAAAALWVPEQRLIPMICSVAKTTACSNQRKLQFNHD